MNKCLFLFFIGFSSFAQEEIIPSSAYWNEEKLEQRVLNQNDSMLWDMERFYKSQPYAPQMLKLDFPLHITEYPTLPYDSEGVSNLPIMFEVNGKRFRSESIALYKDKHNLQRFSDTSQADEVVFTVITQTDLSAGEQVCFVSSRNHPDYVAEGTLPTSILPVDWVAIQNADNTAYALINMRLFNLQYGQVILVAPQQDGTLRFFQIQRPFLSGEKLPGYLDELKQNPDFIQFYNVHGQL